MGLWLGMTFKLYHETIGHALQNLISAIGENNFPDGYGIFGGIPVDHCFRDVITCKDGQTVSVQITRLSGRSKNPYELNAYYC